MTASREQLVEIMSDATVRSPSVDVREWMRVALKALGDYGYVVVPMEATEEMLAAAYDASMPEDKGRYDNARERNAIHMRPRWQAFLSASPYRP